MKKIIVLLIFAAAVLVSGCDTTETTRIRISLGESHRATTPPWDVSTVYIAVYTQYFNGEVWDIDDLEVAAAVPATGSISLVVPTGRELFVMVMAPNADKTFLYYGEGAYPGETSKATGEPLPEYVDIIMAEAEMAASGTWVTNPTGDYQNLQVNWWNEWPGMSDTMMSLLEMRVEKGSSTQIGVETNSYSMIHQESFFVFTYSNGDSYTEDLGTQMNPASDSLWYRMRLSIPVFGLIMPSGDAGSFDPPPAPAK